MGVHCMRIQRGCACIPCTSRMWRHADIQRGVFIAVSYNLTFQKHHLCKQKLANDLHKAIPKLSTNRNSHSVTDSYGCLGPQVHPLTDILGSVTRGVNPLAVWRTSTFWPVEMLLQQYSTELPQRRHSVLWILKVLCYYKWRAQCIWLHVKGSQSVRGRGVALKPTEAQLTALARLPIWDG